MTFLPQAVSELPEQEIAGEDFPLAEECAKDEQGRYQLKALKTKHKHILAFVAQGMQHKQIGALCGVTPQYITMMLRMPICQEFLKGMCEAAGVQLEALLPQTVEVIRDAMQNGDVTERLKGARLQMEATGRIGSKNGRPPAADAMDDRLERLSHRLIDLLSEKRAQSGEVYDGKVQRIRNEEASEGVTGEIRQRILSTDSTDEADGYGGSGSEDTKNKLQESKE